MRPGRPCTVCIDPTLSAKVDALLQSGETLRAIAEITGVNRFAISRHKRHAFPQAEPEPELDELQASDKRLSQLCDQVRSQYAAAVSIGDSKIALDCSKTLSRLESELHRRIVVRKQAEVNDADSERCITPEQFDANKNKVLAAYQQWREKWGWVTCPVCEHNRPIDPRIIPAKIKAYLETSNVNSSATN